MHPFLTIFLILFTLAASAQNKPLPDYARDWRRADSLAAKGLPKSAVEIVNRIYKEAKAQKNYPQLAKAAIARTVYRAYSDEDAFKILIRSLRADVLETREPAKSVLQSVLGDVYWQYFSQNRYKFYERTTVNTTGADKATASADSAADFTTWDARQLVEAATTAYLASVRSKDALQKIPIGAYDVLLEVGDSDARPLRPTLYDLLAHRAIEFFQNTEPDLLKPVFRFELNQPDYFAGPDVFNRLTIRSQDSLSGRYQALLLYQQLLTFHLADTNPNALADADVLRLAFVHQHSILPGRDSLYRQALERQRDQYKNSPAGAVYAYQLAQFLTNYGAPVRPLDDNDESVPSPADPNRWNRKQAADICRDLIKRYPETLAGKQAAQLLRQLLLPSYSFQVEQINLPQQPFRALVGYQNVNKIRYRIIRISIAEVQAYRENRADDSQRRKWFSTWLKRSVIDENSVTLPDDGDLNHHSVEIPIKALPTGNYLLLATTDDTFREQTETLEIATFGVSTLAYLVIPNTNTSIAQTVIVTNRLTGEPLKNAAVSVLAISSKQPKGPKSYRTDANGWVNVVPTDLVNEPNFQYLISNGADTVLSDRQYYYNGNMGASEETAQSYVKLFTDRAIYRPGQAIYVKGLLYNGKTNAFAVVANQNVTISFLDQNGEQLAEQTMKTNEFGTFSTSFTAPVGRLTGEMSLQTAQGSTSIRVEEYKRPTFEVKAQPIKQSFKLGQTITLTAEAKTFSGAVVEGANVRYRVVRRLRPRWDWWYVPRRTGQTEIANGTAQTDKAGNVSITFIATPDRDQARENNPVFDFEVTIDVTDRAGETRSATQTLHIGYSALQVRLVIAEEVETDKPGSFPIRITNQSGEKVAATGQLTVYRLQPPARLLRNRLWSRPDRQLLSREEFEKLFPNDVYANENNPRFWPKGEAVQQLSIKAPGDSLLKPDLNRYSPGEYVAELSVTDSSGETTKERAFFSVVNDKQLVASARPDNWLQARKTTAEPGEEAIFWVGNSQPGWVLMMVEENHKLIRQEWLKTDGKPRRVVLPVSEQQRGGFAVYFVLVQNGRMYQKSQTITVPFTNKQLTIETETFRNKLKPGDREEWTLRVSGLAKTPAELVATLYDASLNAFERLTWPTAFYQPYMPLFYNWHSGSFNVQPGYVFFYKRLPEIAVPTRQYDQLNWFSIRNDAIRISLVNDGKTISGTLKHKYGVGVPGVSIIIKGTSIGTSTNAKGDFSLKIKSGQSPVTLLVSYIGYQTLEMAIAPGTMSSQMNPDLQALNEVVVTGYGRPRAGGPILASGRKGMARMTAASPMMKYESTLAASGVAADEATNSAEEPSPVPQTPVINPRRNFNETAFFLPQLKTDAQGRVVLKFTMPEALTRWRLLAFAHTKDVKTGTLEREIVTQKELMITANAPRFFREGDTIQVQARLTNLSEKPLNNIMASLLLTNALTGELLARPRQTNGREREALAPGLSTAVGWTIIVPKGIELITCRLTAQSGLFTDGEEFTIPVLSNRMLITDSQPFWVNGKETKEFKLKPLTSLSPELPVQHERLTVEVTSNPSWYALQSLPYLMEYRYECAEQLFSRLYANSLAAHIVRSKPVFRQVIAEWQKNPAAKSPLQLNEELKAVTLENSPWLADARSEAERQAKLGQLLDANRMEQEQRLAFAKLEQLQTTDGGFRWFGGMQPDLSMTLHILSGFGHLQKLGVRFPDDLQAKLADMQAKAIRYVDGEMARWMKDQKNEQQKRTIVGSWYFSATQYLYARSFYLDKPVDAAVLSYLKQYVIVDWQKQSLQGQALSALALHRFGDTQTSDNILRSLRERSRESDELGLYWPDNQSGLYWYQTPIETQAYLIEAFDEIKADRASVDNMKRWLLRQKQTQSWSSTKATTEAVYALLLRGSDWLGTGVTTQVSLGGQPIENRVTKADAITGYEKVTYAATEIKPAMGVIKVTKSTDGPAWGALYWQHFEPLDRVMAGSTGLSVQKTLTVQRDSPNGPIISPVTGGTSLKPGDLIKVRLVLKTDRVMEYVHLKDGRASGFEPVAALSGYKYQNGLGYYESPRDASTDFFIGYLPVGTHVFEYDLRVAQTGDFSAGIATVQCFYAPEFSAHSAGERVKVN